MIYYTYHTVLILYVYTFLKHDTSMHILSFDEAFSMRSA